MFFPFPEGVDKDKMEEWGHSTAQDAARCAKEAGVSQLYLFHLSPRYKDAEGHIAEASKIFPGVVVPSDLDVLTIK